MSAIKDLPSAKDYGLGFNYSVWTAGTSVTLCNVPWNSDYRDIVRFNTPGMLDDYLKRHSGPVIEITKLSYAKFGRPIRLDTPFNAVQEFNYIRVANSLQPISGDKPRVFYYFITDVVYINPNCTEIFVQLDAWQTFGHTTSFGNCYIEQGHIGIANEESFNDFGREHLTTPEGLDVGNEYQIVANYSHNVASARTPMSAGGQPNYSILVASTISLDVEDYGTVESPILHSAKGSEMENLPNGCELYEFNTIGHFKSFMEYLSDKPWIAQGIISITAIPRTQRYGVETETTFVGGSEIPVREIKGGTLKTVETVVATNWRNSINLGRYGVLKKFLTFPYSLIEMTSYTGTPLVLKPECWGTRDATVVEVPHFAPPQARVAFYPFRYNSSDQVAPVRDAHGLLNDGGEFLDMVTGIYNMPTFSVVNNGYMQFMASNANSIAYQHSSADWSQQKTMQGISTSYDQASAGINTSQSISQQGINAASQSANLSNQTAVMQGGLSAANSAISAIGNRNPLGAVAGIANAAIGTAIGVNQTNQSTQISNTLSAGTNKSTTDNMAYMRDTNKSLSEFSANGDYQNAIAGINARVQDAKLTQPTTAGQVGGDAFNLANYRWGVDLKVKMVQPAVMRAIGEYWLRYGYAINRFGRLPFDFHAMEKFTYWKLKETYIIKSSCPESIKQVIRGIFEKGVTVWRDPDDIGMIDIADNAPLNGLRI